MSPERVLQELADQQLINDKQRAGIQTVEDHKLFSAHWELRSLLYVGILLFTTGTGWLIYKYIDQIGHTFLIIALSVLCAASFAFAVRYKGTFTRGRSYSRSPFGDYALLLACLLFLSLEGYLQYQYTIFGTRYGLVTFLPAILFLSLAYLFDHRGVLAMGLTALISWIGVTVRPLEFYFKGNLKDMTVLLSALALSIFLMVGALMLDRQRIKPHFTITTLGFAGNLLLVALLAGLFNFENLHLQFALALAVACAGFDWYARRERSFLFLLMSTFYGYIGATYLVFHYLHLRDEATYLYWLITGIGVTVYLSANRKIDAVPGVKSEEGKN
ncbi:putative membrane protein DUF2157 [Larkinella arboricola]|uniref:Putative membrane protein DUF2157 n=1 Tax=Larkinella arboricola TaxID=643671 RepID=A0A327WVT6_LARAB|nr:DUF2157 domain-containing protein [Larkinella arboricola]RAJ95841.1 putative membrane protein DUF2157 [Larkinella arboricola]